MATDAECTPHLPSFFTNGMSPSEYRNALEIPPDRAPLPHSEIRRRERITNTAPSTKIGRYLFYGSTPDVGRNFDPGLGPIGSGRPRPCVSGKVSPSTKVTFDLGVPFASGSSGEEKARCRAKSREMVTCEGVNGMFNHGQVTMQLQGEDEISRLTGENTLLNILNSISTELKGILAQLAKALEEEMAN